MLRFVTGSLFDSDTQTLVNPVNRVGVSGAGLAKEFKKRFPEMHSYYALACAQKRMGNLLLWPGHSGEPSVLCFATKEHWREPSTFSLIIAGLSEFMNSKWVRGGAITSIAFPALGCGNGGLAWHDVRPLMTRYLEHIDIPITIHEPMAATRKR